MPQDDRTSKARIRDAAIAVVAREGNDAMTARRVAEAADVSPGLVAHHYGSMDGLQETCDHHVAALVRETKQAAMAQGAGLDPLAALRGAGLDDVLAYLARRLSQDAPAVARLVDELVDDAEVYLAAGEATGMIRPSDDPRGRAVMSVVWSLGGLVLHEHLDRLLGVDLTDPDVGSSPRFTRYARPALDVLGRGLLTPEFAAQVLARFPDPELDPELDPGLDPGLGPGPGPEPDPEPNPEPKPDGADRSGAPDDADHPDGRIGAAAASAMREAPQ